MREKRPYLELFWSSFSRIRTEYGEIGSISPSSVRMQENADQNDSVFWHFFRSEVLCHFAFTLRKLLLKTKKNHVRKKSFHRGFEFKKIISFIKKKVEHQKLKLVPKM